jgi:hypothetical protein
MLLNETIPLLRLTDDEDAARSAIAAAADSLVRTKVENPRLRVVATGETLSASTIAALISALRRLRERGGAIELTGETESARATILLNGLERVFAFPLVPEEESPRAHRRGRMGGIFRGAAAAVAFFVALVGFAVPAKADSADTTDPGVILARVMQRNPDLASYQSRVHVKVRLISFPFISQQLEGSTYFKRPANYEVVFDRVPSYAKGFEKLYSDVGDPANWEQRFVITYVGERAFESRSDVVLNLVQRVRGMIDHETVLIDPSAWTIDQIRYDYYNGGVVTMTQHFAVIDGYSMLSSQVAEIRIPHVRAIANGTYTDYRTNVAIAESVFTKKN